jgi:mitogen-activated protein kinase 1/3
MHIPSKKNFAMKRFEQVFSNDLRAKRLIREISILKSARHPCVNSLKCVIKPTDLEKFDDVYLVIEQCDMDLKKLLKSSKYLSEEQVKSIVYDMLCGLNYLHKSQIVHRDLKPANILINDDCTIHICDFGLARSLKGVKTQFSSEQQSSSSEASGSTVDSREPTPKGISGPSRGDDSSSNS